MASAFYRSFKLFKGFAVPNRIEISPLELQMQTGDAQSLQYKIYYPKSKSHGYIYVFHGLSPKGNQDDRIINLCKAFSYAGFTIISPHLPSIANLKIEPEQISQIKDTILQLNHKYLTSDAKAAIVAPSLTAGFVLSAAADNSIRKQISSLCLIGAYSDVVPVMKFMFTAKEVDFYGLMAITKNFIQCTRFANDPHMVEAMDGAMRSNYQNGSYEIPDSTPKHIYDCINQLFADPDFRLAVLNELIEEYHKVAVYESMRVLPRIKDVDAALFLLHGSKDTVIPPTESIAIKEEAKKYNKKYYFLKSPVISHGDTAFPLWLMGHIGRLIWGFAWFIRQSSK